MGGTAITPEEKAVVVSNINDYNALCREYVNKFGVPKSMNRLVTLWRNREAFKEESLLVRVPKKIEKSIKEPLHADSLPDEAVILHKILGELQVLRMVAEETLSLERKRTELAASTAERFKRNAEQDSARVHEGLAGDKGVSNS